MTVGYLGRCNPQMVCVLEATYVVMFSKLPLRRETDSVLGFIGSDRCRFAPALRTSRKDLYEAYQAWCGSEGLRIDVTQQSLADATGSVREVVSRALGQLRRQGVVARNGDGVTVLDPEGLRRAAGL